MIELIFKLEQYDFLCKYVPEIKEYEKNRMVEEGKVKLDMKKDDFYQFQDDYNDSIIYYGMDNYDTVNKIGIELYAIFDECIL